MNCDQRRSQEGGGGGHPEALNTTILKKYSALYLITGFSSIKQSGYNFMKLVVSTTSGFHLR